VVHRPVPFDDADDLFDACVKLRQEGIVLKRLDARYMQGVRTDAWRKVKAAAWRNDHAPRRMPKEIRERVIAAQIKAMTPVRDTDADQNAPR
jgi:hypothetical protein